MAAVDYGCVKGFVQVWSLCISGGLCFGFVSLGGFAFVEVSGRGGGRELRWFDACEVDGWMDGGRYVLGALELELARRAGSLGKGWARCWHLWGVTAADRVRLPHIAD